MCRDYGLYSQNWMGDGKWGYINEGIVRYDIAAVFHYMNDRDMRLYHKYRSIPKVYRSIYILCAQAQDSVAYDLGQKKINC